MRNRVYKGLILATLFCSLFSTPVLAATQSAVIDGTSYTIDDSAPAYIAFMSSSKGVLKVSDDVVINGEEIKAIQNNVNYLLKRIGNSSSTDTGDNTYSSTKSYAVGDIVSNKGAWFECIKAVSSSDGIELSNTEYWKPISIASAIVSVEKEMNSEISKLGTAAYYNLTITTDSNGKSSATFSQKN